MRSGAANAMRGGAAGAMRSGAINSVGNDAGNSRRFGTSLAAAGLIKKPKWLRRRPLQRLDHADRVIRRREEADDSQRGPNVIPSIPVISCLAGIPVILHASPGVPVVAHVGSTFR
jgi:hypothetical protein